MADLKKVGFVPASLTSDGVDSSENARSLSSADLFPATSRAFETRQAKALHLIGVGLSPNKVDLQAAKMPTPQKSGIKLENVDKDVRPQDDMYRHVNGTWLKRFQIPADKAAYGAFTMLREKSIEDVKAIVDELVGRTDLKAGSDEQKIADLYKSWMNEAAIEKKGLQPLGPISREIDAIKDKSQLAAWYAKAQTLGIPSPLSIGVEVDAKNPKQYITYLSQSGLGLPDRDFYTNTDPKSMADRNAYQMHLAKMFALAGWKNPQGSAQRVFSFEEKLARAHWTKVENRDPQKSYNKKTPAELEKLASNMDWQQYLKGLGIAGEESLIVEQPTYIEKLGKILNETSLEDLKLHAKWHLLRDSARYLPKKFADENFHFYSKTLNGIQAQQPRWKSGIGFVEMLGEALGKIYVEKHFPAEAKVRMETMVRNILDEFGRSIENSNWMEEATKKAATEKKNKFVYKIGYPNKWHDYNKLAVRSDDLFGNTLRAAKFNFDEMVAKLHKPIDRGEWGMTPQTVNAYYNPLMNEIVFPAAILQPPFFNLEAEDAVNYGGIGAVIGHEIGHGFDDQGAMFDGDGKLRQWFTDADLKKFRELSSKLVEQYNNFEVLPGLKINGKLTLGENIGDLVGVAIAYRAYQHSLNGKPAPVIDGLTAEQRFFMGFAQVWSQKSRPEALRQLVMTDPHSPAEFRANVVRNIEEFYKAFDVKPGDKLYLNPEDRVKIW